MNYATVCSGVEAMSLAVAGMGWKPVFFSEIEPFPCQLLKHRFPSVPNLGDMTKIEGDKYYGSVDVLAGGTPCQSFSVAGKRGGIEDGRGKLMLHFVKLAYETGARYVAWENVPGVLSSGKGDDFAALLSSLCGNDVSVPEEGWANSGVVTNAEGCYGVAWRVLDAQYTRVPGFPLAVPQRRRRVWLVGYLGDWRRAAEVLFVGESLPWHFEAGEREGQEAAGGVADRAGTASGKPFTASSFGVSAEGVGTVRAADGKGNNGQNAYDDKFVVCYENHANDSRVTDSGNLSPTITSRCDTGGGNLPLVKVTCARESGQGYWMEDEIAGTLRCEGENRPSRPSNVIAQTPIAISDVVHGDKACNGKGWNDDGSAYTLDTMATQGVCYGFNGTQSAKARSMDESEELCPTLRSCAQTHVSTNLVRRLLPTETELLMGFPKHWTDIRPNGKPTPDSPRYKACGNSWAVNCARWVMMRIQQSEDKYKDTP